MITVHPHVCGERARSGYDTRAGVGSSPRVWGTRVNPRQGANDSRFIPTCVGNASRSCGPWWVITVHPHVCGERNFSQVSTPGISGSSPRVWGTQHLTGSRCVVCRFIPTCVGNACRHGLGRVFYAVHPHVCGERFASISFKNTNRGSSPRVWGTRGGNEKTVSLWRFIPTCVGNAGLCIPIRGVSSVHPHVCGERRPGEKARYIDAGSSPRVWGTQATLLETQVNVRFIPTCVGNARSRHCNRPSHAVHPHVCGERLRPP